MFKKPFRFDFVDELFKHIIPPPASGILPFAKGESVSFLNLSPKERDLTSPNLLVSNALRLKSRIFRQRYTIFLS